MLSVRGGEPASRLVRWTKVVRTTGAYLRRQEDRGKLLGEVQALLGQQCRQARVGPAEHHLAQIIHERVVNNLELMTTDKFPMTNGRRGSHHCVEGHGHHRLRFWSLAIEIWSFPQDSRVLIANNAG